MLHSGIPNLKPYNAQCRQKVQIREKSCWRWCQFFKVRLTTLWTPGVMGLKSHPFSACWPLKGPTHSIKPAAFSFQWTPGPKGLHSKLNCAFYKYQGSQNYEIGQEDVVTDSTGSSRFSTRKPEKRNLKEVLLQQCQQIFGQYARCWKMTLILKPLMHNVPKCTL